MKLSKEILTKLRAAYDENMNLTELLKLEGFKVNSLAIEVIYDLQAGSYTQFAQENPEHSRQFVSEVANLIAPHIASCSSLLDAGTGEGTSIIPLIKKLDLEMESYAFDISWSRLSFAIANSISHSTNISFAVGDMLNIPMATSSIDMVLTIHALEPNGGREVEILRELARVSKKKVILIEPDFDNASNEQKSRMQRLSYIGSLKDAISAAGLTIIDIIPLSNNVNPLNCASVYILKPNSKKLSGKELTRWVDPIFHSGLAQYEGGLRNAEGLWFPVLRGIPFLRQEDAKLTLNPAASGQK